jgi:N-glycosidase YbiA
MMTRYVNDRFNSEAFDEALAEANDQLVEHVDELTDDSVVISGFRGSYSFLSNFAPSPIVSKDDRLPIAPTVEHAYQASKTLITDLQIEILTAATPGKAKRLGRALALRPDWEQVKVPTMWRCLQQKFQLPGSLANRLIDTAPALLFEANEWGDTFWGVCGGRGENVLGRLLMQQRDALIASLPTFRQAEIIEWGPSRDYDPVLIEY